MSISVSPLLKVHNDTDFSLELRFQRPQHEETDSATLVLKAGDVLDDSMAAFGAIDLSGGLRKALTSLSVGMPYISITNCSVGYFVINFQLDKYLMLWYVKATIETFAYH